MVDLTNVTLSALRGCEAENLELSVKRMMAQIDTPRVNLGTSGPPGRVD